jgi:signal transduction histidine kinase
VKLRPKILLAQLPLVAGLAITIAIGGKATRDLGDASQRILTENYASVRAAQTMKETAERIDSGVAFANAGRVDIAAKQIDENIPRFETALREELDNITEPGEREKADHLQATWREYRAAIARVRADLAAPTLHDVYFATLLPEFLAVKDAADTILTLNQDAMWKKTNHTRDLAGRLELLLVALSGFTLLVGALASSAMTTRVLRPLSVLAQTARRLGEGDVGVRAKIDSQDEIGELARELNTMADRIHRYRQSSLGELLEAQLAAQAAIDSLPDPVLVIGLDGELRHANQAAETILKVHAEAGAHALATLDPDVRAVVDRLRQHVAAGRGAYVPKGLEEAVRFAGDGERLLLPRAAPLYAAEGDVIAATIVLSDVTRQRRFEELRNDLVATVAHELRTPLTSLRMAVHLLAEQSVGALTLKQADLVFAAREECDRLQSVVDELLDLSRIEADRVELRVAPIDPEALVDAALEAQRGAADGKHVRLVAEVLPNLPAVAVDRERIALVFANLLGNALRYGASGGVVTVRATPHGERMRFEVTDRGPGIAPEYQQSIFEKYVRVPGAPIGGAGIGLYIAREIVRAHGGEIGVDSADGDGATFWFEVALAKQQEAA